MMYTKGFTLIEMLVSVAIFTIVMVVSLGALLSLSEANRKAELLSSATNNFNSALDSMSRSIRTGTNFHCGSGTLATPTDCPSGSTEFAYLAAAGNEVVYQFSSNPSLCANSVGCIVRSTDGGATYTSITSADIVVTSLQFFVKGAPSGDTIQPKVNILISGYVDVTGKQQSLFNIETSVTQRIFDQ